MVVTQNMAVTQDETSLGRREKKKLVNRQAILNAGLDIFSEQGFDNATITDLVKASGLSVGTFYNYFGDKESIFSELVEQFLEQARSALNEARTQAHSLEEFVMQAFLAYSQVMENNPRMQRLISKNNHAFRQFVFGGGEISGMFEDLERDMNKAIELGLMPPFPVRLMTSAMIGAGAEIFAFDTDLSQTSTKEKAEFLGHLFLGGIERIAKNNKKIIND